VTVRITIHCDGPHCRQGSRTQEGAKRDGWTIDMAGRDLCARCAEGKCSGEVGRDDCSCLLPLDHEGRCACAHTIGTTS
jgi:hypothetical protein